MVKLPGHTCPNIDKAQRQLRRLAWRVRHGKKDDVSEVLVEGLKVLEAVRQENIQMRAAYYSIKEELDELRRK